MTFEQFSELLLKSTLDAALQTIVSHDREVSSAAKTNPLKHKRLLFISNKRILAASKMKKAAEIRTIIIYFLKTCWDQIFKINADN